MKVADFQADGGVGNASARVYGYVGYRVKLTLKFEKWQVLCVYTRA